MTKQDDGRNFCLEIADLPRGDIEWLTATAAAIEDAISEEMASAFGWHSVEPDPGIGGVRVLFEAATDDGISDSVAEALTGIIRRVVTDRSDPDAAAA